MQNPVLYSVRAPLQSKPNVCAWCCCSFILCALVFGGVTTCLYYSNTDPISVKKGLQASRSLESLELSQAFEKFSTSHKRLYLTQEEKQSRMKIFQENYQKIKEINQMGLGYELAINHFADLTEEEFKNHYLKHPIKAPQTKATKGLLKPAPINAEGEIDWIKKGKVARPKDQAMLDIGRMILSMTTRLSVWIKKGIRSFRYF